MINSRIRTVSAIAVLDLANELLVHKVLSHGEIHRLFPEYLVLTDDASRQGHQFIQEARIAEAVLVSLWRAADANPALADIGVEIGARVNHQAKGLLANWLSQAATIGQALDIFRQNIALLNPSEDWSLADTQEADRCTLVFQFTSPFQYPRMAYERSMVALIAWGRFLCGMNIAIKQLTFAFPRPCYIEKLIDLFGDIIVFDAPQNSISFARDALELKLESSNAYLLNIVSQRAQDILDQLTDSTSFSQKVAQLIRSDIVFFSEINKLAEAFHMSRATLYRKLKNEGQTYQSILDEVRKAAAIDAIAKRQKIECIAHDLGYKDKRSFYKAYRRWYQQKPSSSLQ